MGMKRMIYRIAKLLNHNSFIGIESGAKQECLIMGKGIAFGKKIGQTIEVPQDARIYSLKELTDRGDAREIINSVSPVCLELANEILREAEAEFGDIDRSILFPIADHLDFAIRRLQRGEQISNPLTEDIRILFYKEYKVAGCIAPMLKEKYDRNDLRPNKYFDVADKNGNFPVLKCGSTQFSCSFRTGEIYLNAAEAAVHLNKLSEARGRLLKLIENRYTPEGYTLKKNEIEAMSQEALLAEIQEERTKELAFEGHRWFDLRRTTRPRIEKVIDGKTYILEKDDARYTLRIPQAAIDANPELQH